MSVSHEQDPEIARLCERLELQPHPEGGYYRETYRHAAPPGARGDLTAIYYLLKGGPPSAWHRVLDADEVWCFHGGAALELHIRTVDGQDQTHLLGNDVDGGQSPQFVVRRGEWQRAKSLGSWSFTSCVVGPAFEFDAFEMRAPGVEIDEGSKD